MKQDDDVIRQAFDLWYAIRHPKPVHEHPTWAHARKCDDYEVWRAASGAYLRRIAELEVELVAEAKKTASEKLRADQMTEQHRMQAKMHSEASEEVVRLKTQLGLSAFSPHDPGRAAIATLKGMGYEHHGGVQWAPPVREMATCGCGDQYPAGGWDAGFIAALGHCANCAAALDPVTPEPAPSTAWYPDYSGEWVEVPDSITTWPPGLNGSELVDVLMRGERDHKGWSTDSDLAWSWDWAHPCCHPSRIVAYKVVKP